MSTDTLLSVEELQKEQAALAQSLEQKRIAAREAAAERRKRLMALGPKFVGVIKAGQPFTRFTDDASEEVFVWYDQPPGRAGVLHWEPLLEDGNEQPKLVVPERSLRFSAISDIFMGRLNGALAQHTNKANIKLCLSFVVHSGNEVPSLHLMARNKAQSEAWMYGVQHILKQGGFHFLEANEAADKREAEIFSQYSAKQLVKLLSQKAPEVASLRLQATLNQMNRGAVFKRYLPGNTCVDVLVFFGSDGGKGTLFWGPRAHPEGYLPLRTVADVWLGKHDLLKQPIAANVDSSHCVSLVSKRHTLALQAPSKGVMTQWMFGIHSLLTATPELIASINTQQQKQQEEQKEADGKQAGDAADASSSSSSSASSSASSQVEGVDSSSSNNTNNNTNSSSDGLNDVVATAGNMGISFNVDDDTFDESALDQDAVAEANAIEAEVERRMEQVLIDRANRAAAEEARAAARAEAERREEEAKRSVLAAANSAMEAIEAARAMREAVEKASLNASLEEVLGLGADLASYADAPAANYDDDDDEEDDDEEQGPGSGESKNGGDGGGGDDFAFDGAGRGGRGRRLSLFSSLELDEDVKKALTFDINGGNGAADDDDEDVDAANGAAEGPDCLGGDSSDAPYSSSSSSASGDLDSDAWTTLKLDLGTGELEEAISPPGRASFAPASASASASAGEEPAVDEDAAAIEGESGDVVDIDGNLDLDGDAGADEDGGDDGDVGGLSSGLGDLVLGDEHFGSDESSSPSGATGGAVSATHTAGASASTASTVGARKSSPLSSATGTPGARPAVSRTAATGASTPSASAGRTGGSFATPATRTPGALGRPPTAPGTPSTASRLSRTPGGTTGAASAASTTTPAGAAVNRRGSATGVPGPSPKPISTPTASASASASAARRSMGVSSLSITAASPVPRPGSAVTRTPTAARLAATPGTPSSASASSSSSSSSSIPAPSPRGATPVSTTTTATRTSLLPTGVRRPLGTTTTTATSSSSTAATGATAGSAVPRVAGVAARRPAPGVRIHIDNDGPSTPAPPSSTTASAARTSGTPGAAAARKPVPAATGAFKR